MLTKNHEKFLSHLDRSNGDTWLVAMWLQSRGNTVSVNGLRKAPSVDQWSDFVDTGDLVLHRRVEVKGLSASFTGLHDWPFKNEFIVCGKDSFDRAQHKPELFFYLNRERTHIAVLDVRKTIHFWSTKEVKDKRFGEDYSQVFYICKPDNARFMSMYESKEGAACVT